MFGSADWFTNYGHIEADFMLPGYSNHSPVLLNTGLPTRPLKRHFRLLTVLLKQDDFHTAAHEDKLNEDFFNPQLIDAEKEVLVHLKKWEAINEGVLRQKSRATWISGGDATLKYFHALESQTGKE
ncbi:hypothetical protein KY284_013221 [Solanum tuberosum]|nr:hypothetical protein KY284_013221 [Solanum tuberosum]